MNSDKSCKNVSIYEQAFSSLRQELDIGFENGHIYKLQSLQERFQHHLSSCGMDSCYTGHNLKQRLSKCYGSKIHFVRPLNQSQSLLVFPAVQIETAIIAAEQASTGLKDALLKEEMSIQPDTRNIFLLALHVVAATISD